METKTIEKQIQTGNAGRFSDFAYTNSYLQRLTRVRVVQPDYDMCLRQIEAFGRNHFPGFVIDDNNRFVYLNLVKWMYGDPTMECHNPLSKGKISKMRGDLNKGIYLAGSTGSGKSVALEIINALARWEGIPFFVGDERFSLRWRANLAANIHEEIAEDHSKLAEYKNLHVLCVQDLGGESEDPAVYMGNRVYPLKSILESRGDRQDQLTVISSNHSPLSEVMVSRYSSRCVSRLLGMTNYLVLGGADRRCQPYAAEK